MKSFKRFKPIKKFMYEDQYKSRSYQREMWNVPLQYTSTVAQEPEEEPEEEYEDDYE